jgi:integrase
MKEAGLIDPEVKEGRAVQRPRYTPYALRHYYASKLIELGRDFKSIQTALGHSSIEITFNVYGHLIRDKEDAHRKAAETLMSSLAGFAPRFGDPGPPTAFRARPERIQRA